jgi:hypothetical protein
MHSNWNQIAQMFELLAHLRKAEWKCDVPPYDALPDEELDLAVSAWCSQMAGNLMQPIDPPDEVKPWILARLTIASVQARLEAEERNPCPEVSPETVRNMLVASWHQLLRDKWNMMVTVDLPEV